MASTNEILKELQRLPKDDLRKVISTAQYLLTLNRRIVPAAPKKEVVASPLVEVLQVYSKKYVPVPLYLTQKAMERLNKIAKELEHLASKLGLSRKETIKLCDVLLETGVCKLEERRKPLSFQSLLWCLSDVPSILMEAYPGYFGGAFFREKVLNAKAK